MFLPTHLHLLSLSESFWLYGGSTVENQYAQQINGAERGVYHFCTLLWRYKSRRSWRHQRPLF